ncbi:hypothetical protein UlMin_017761 [Ulmus minor]
MDDEKSDLDLGTTDLSPSATSLDLSINSLMGFTSSHTMKVKGLLGAHEVVILIDSGESHSFIATKLVHELKLPYEVTNGVGVVVGNGMSFKQEGVCRAVQLVIQGCEVIDDLFPFELGSVDIVLGVTWLRTMGEVRANWEKFTMCFLKNGSWVSFVRDPTLCYSLVISKAMDRSFQVEGYGILIELCWVNKAEVEVFEE